MTTAAPLRLPRIHILGNGNVGNLLAHSLRSQRNPPPVTLLLHNLHIQQRFRACGHRIRVERNRIASVVTGFEYEVTDRAMFEAWAASAARPISRLIVATKAHQTRVALESIKDRLNADSTVMLVQNGMGALEDIKTHLWPNEEDRPNIVIGINSHGAHTIRPFSVIHAGFGKIDLSVVPREPPPQGQPYPNIPPTLDSLPPTTRELLNILLECHDLGYSLTSYPDIIAAQLEKLAVNAVINPLSVMFNCYNGQLLYNFPISRMFRLIIFEISKVIAAMPELDNLVDREIRFSPERLEKVVVGVAKKTATNISSMLQDVRAGKPTEVEYINGYVVRKGADLGIPCAVNFMLREMVKGKLDMIGPKVEGDLPVDDPDKGPYEMKL
ncbi:hypothetical protein H072_4585 [Dactylellina haptotyla CBS 200.50]|uniref:2-dehydropantoate 2-reductase n=1 Tax=Dactylellina haptotyla (strain CBS 200.50) TaxID=1284197 RepID=S8AK80_DACHA|nr:hypothetical protein H072_4585 [Dactylellina haptotyla CBS 200.50]